MKKLFFSFLSLLVAFNMAFAGGLVTNTNQSASWARMLVRDASTSIDAAYFNPAGLTKLADGFHISISNQSIFQDRTITNDAAFISTHEFNGTVSAPFFPNFYAAYKTGKLAFSLGFTPIGGGGSANFEQGIPMIEMMIATQFYPLASAALTPLATGLATTINGYDYTASFEGSSMYLGIQGGVSYAISDKISAYLGARYVIAKNAYKGSVTNLAITTANSAIVFNATTLPGYGASAAVPYFADLEVDAEQNGTGFTPILGANIALMEDKLNIGLKYEFQTNMEVTNETTTDDVGMYPDGEKENADIPAMLSIGVGYKLSDKLSTQIGYHTYFDKGAGWSTIEDSDPEQSVIDKNYWELGLGFEYNINEKLLFSLGYLRAQTGVNDYYQSDMSYSLSSNTFGLGGAFRINDMINLNLGGYYTMYQDETVSYPVGGTEVYTQTYKKTNFAFAIGLDFAFGGGK